MKVTDEMIIDCAFSKGFKLPTKTFEHFGRTYDISEKDIVIHRAKTAPIAGNRDLGEWWWLSYPGGISTFVVKDDDLKAYKRDYKIDLLLK